MKIGENLKSWKPAQVYKEENEQLKFHFGS